MDLVYYKNNKLLWRWSKKEGARIVREARLSMERAPPVLSAPSPPAPIAKVMPLPRRPKPDPIVKMAEDLGKVGALFLFFIDPTPHGTECHESKSPDGRYTAERCLLDWVSGGNSEYVGRVFDSESGKKLAQHTCTDPVKTCSSHNG